MRTIQLCAPFFVFLACTNYTHFFNMYMYIYIYIYINYISIIFFILYYVTSFHKSKHRFSIQKTITSETICMKRLDLVKGNFCRITSIHFTNVHNQSSWESQFKLLIYIYVSIFKQKNERNRSIYIQKFKQKKFDHNFFIFFLFFIFSSF